MDVLWNTRAVFVQHFASSVTQRGLFGGWNLHGQGVRARSNWTADFVSVTTGFLRYTTLKFIIWLFLFSLYVVRWIRIHGCEFQMIYCVLKLFYIWCCGKCKSYVKKGSKLNSNDIFQNHSHSFFKELGTLCSNMMFSLCPWSFQSNPPPSVRIICWYQYTCNLFCTALMCLKVNIKSNIFIFLCFSCKRHLFILLLCSFVLRQSS